MDPLPQYGSHAFLPYLPQASPPSPTRSSPLSRKSSAESLLLPSSHDLPPISLLNTSSWMYTGPLLPACAARLPSSLHTWIAHTISGPFLPRLLPFLAFLNTFLSNAGAQHYWLTIRATTPTHDYDSVRWHTDDIFFDIAGEEARKGRYWKLATTLLGPNTLFLKDSSKARKVQREAKKAELKKRGGHNCTSFRCLGCLEATEAVRQTLAEAFEGKEVQSPPFGTAAFFRLGDNEGAVHSEPPCAEDRIFVNVVPGTEDELRALMDRWGLGFPRAWCFGVPVSFDDDAVKAVLEQRDSVDGVLEGNVELSSGLEKKAGESTMSLNLKDEYKDWLKDKGFRYSQVFGQTKA